MHYQVITVLLQFQFKWNNSICKDQLVVVVLVCKGEDYIIAIQSEQQRHTIGVERWSEICILKQ